MSRAQTAVGVGVIIVHAPSLPHFSLSVWQHDDAAAARAMTSGAGGAAAAAPAAAGQSKASLTDALVHLYLRKRGFNEAAAKLPAQARAALPMESLTEPQVEAVVRHRLLSEDGVLAPEDFVAAFTRLRDWVHGSLDLYKVRATGSDQGRLWRTGGQVDPRLVLFGLCRVVVVGLLDTTAAS
jgi:hypothetical protein